MTESKLIGRADVVSLRGYKKSMSYDPIADIEAYWEELRGVRVVPLRSEVDPRKFERALDCTFLLERNAPGLARFRLAGMKFTELMGMEVRGMPVTSLLTPPAREEVREALNMLFEGPNAVTIGMRAENGLGRPKLHGRMVLLPLKSDLGDISRAIGCLSLDGKIGLTPRRFDMLSINYRSVGPFRTAQPAVDIQKEKALATEGFAEPAVKYRHKRKGPGPQLTLIKNEALVKADEKSEN